MNDKTALELLDSGALVETLQVKLSALDVIEYEAACAVRRVKPSTHARNMMIAFAREVAREQASEFQVKVAGARDEFIERKKRVAKKNEGRFVEMSTAKKKKAK
jgi:hypothetical protein